MISPRGSNKSMILSLRRAFATAIPLTILLVAGCGNGNTPLPPTSPPPTPSVTASAYILPGAIALNDFAFGDKPIVIYKNERLRWVNIDTLPHVIVADAPDATDFRKTDELPPGGEQLFTMTRLGTTRLHCDIHPNMTGTLIVRER